MGHFFGLKILNFNIFGGFQKNKYILGYEDFLGVITKLDYIYFFLCILGSFLKVIVQNGDIFWGLMWMMPLHLHVNQKSDYDDMMVAKISNIFLGCLKFLIFFGGEG